MSEIGKVVELIDADKIKVKMKRNEACANCHACTSGENVSEMFVVVDNLCNANLDDFVKIELKTKYFFSAVGIMYGIPCILMLLGFFIGNYFSYLLPNFNADIITFFTGIIFMLFGYLGIRINYFLKGDSKFIPTAIKIVDKNNIS